MQVRPIYVNLVKPIEKRVLISKPAELPESSQQIIQSPLPAAPCDYASLPPTAPAPLSYPPPPAPLSYPLPAQLPLSAPAPCAPPAPAPCAQSVPVAPEALAGDVLELPSESVFAESCST